MLSIPKSKAAMPRSVRDIFYKAQSNPDEEPGENNIVEVRCLNINEKVLAYGSFVTPTREFSGSMHIQAAGYCAVIRTRTYWAAKKTWVPGIHYTNDPFATFKIANQNLSRGDLVRVTGRITGDL